MRLFFARLDEKHNLLESFEKIFLRKLLKMHYFCIFFKKFNKPCVNFCPFGRKMQIVVKFLKNFEENSIEKLNFYFIFNFIFRKFVTKYRAFGNNTSFLQQFFSVSGDFPHFPVGYALALR